MLTVMLVSETITSVVMTFAVKTVWRVVPVRVNSKFTPLYSIAPASAVVKLVPLVNFKGAVEAVAVPAAR